MVKQISDNEMHLLIKYIKSVLWRLAKRLSYIQDARCLEIKIIQIKAAYPTNTYISYHLLFLTDATFYKFRYGAISTSSKLGSMLLNMNRK